MLPTQTNADYDPDHEVLRINGKVFYRADAGMMVLAEAVVPERVSLRIHSLNGITDSGSGGESSQADVPDILS